MSLFLRLLCATSLVATAACQPSPPQQAAHSPAPPLVVQADTARSAASLSPRPAEPHELTIKLPAYLRSHRRYVGTLDGRKLVLELMPNDNPYQLLTSSLYYVNDPHAELFEGALTGPGSVSHSLKLEMSADTVEMAAIMLLPPFGRRLRAFWTAGRGVAPQPVLLHEDYTGAVRYEVLTATAKGEPMKPQQYDDEVTGRIPSYTHAYLHLLGPDTLRPGLRRLQALPPRQMRKVVRHYLRYEEEGSCEETENVYVTLNGYDLLSYVVFTSNYMFGSPHPQHTEQIRTVDLRTGQPVSWQTWFQADADPALRRLIYQRLIATTDTASYFRNVFNARTGMEDLPEQYRLTPAGIVAYYGDYVLGPYSRGSTGVLLPFAEVASLLNRGTPLDRILAARGLRAGRKPLRSPNQPKGPERL